MTAHATQIAIPGCGVSLEEYEAAAIAALQHYEAAALKLDPDGYYLADSFGKDSCVILDLAKRAGVAFVAHHSLTTVDAPELIWFGRDHHPETIVHRPAVPLLMRLVMKTNGPPTRRQRWCCDEYKESHGNESFAVFGVRAAESPRRAKKWGLMQRNRRGDGHGMILAPIVDWPDEIVWRYLREREVPYCSLYDEGWTRLGCVGCPMAGKGRLREFERWPKIGGAWKRAVFAYWEKWHGVPRRDGKPRAVSAFPTPDSYWLHWLEEMPAPDGKDCQRGLF